jgi:hypothetical protein
MINVLTVMVHERRRNSIKRVDDDVRREAVRRREEVQVDLLTWLLAFQHEADPLTRLDVVHFRDRIKTVKGKTVVLPDRVREVLRNQPLDHVRERLEQLHRTRVGGVLATGAAGPLSRSGVQRFHRWWHDVCERVLSGGPTDRGDEIRLPLVMPVLRVYSRPERVDVAQWPHTLKLQSVALLLKFLGRISTCPALTDRGQAKCSRPFVRVRRQQHCSVTCAQRERSRRWLSVFRRKGPYILKTFPP